FGRRFLVRGSFGRRFLVRGSFGRRFFVRGFRRRLTPGPFGPGGERIFAGGPRIGRFRRFGRGLLRRRHLGLGGLLRFGRLLLRPAFGLRGRIAPVLRGAKVPRGRRRFRRRRSLVRPPGLRQRRRLGRRRPRVGGRRFAAPSAFRSRFLRVRGHRLEAFQ